MQAQQIYRIEHHRDKEPARKLPALDITHGQLALFVRRDEQEAANLIDNAVSKLASPEGGSRCLLVY
jgi:glucose-6-phosphate 1-dehydrogenase